MGIDDYDNWSSSIICCRLSVVCAFLQVSLLVALMFHLNAWSTWIFTSTLCSELRNLLCNLISKQIKYCICYFLDCCLWGSLKGIACQLSVQYQEAFFPYLMLKFLQPFFCKGWNSLAFNINPVSGWIPHYITISWITNVKSIPSHL